MEKAEFQAAPWETACSPGWSLYECHGARHRNLSGSYVNRNGKPSRRWHISYMNRHAT